MLDDYELIVFNDAPRPDLEKKIREMCDRYQIRSVRYEQDWHLQDPLNLQIQQWVKKAKEVHPVHPGVMIDESSLETIAQHGSVRHSHLIQFALDHFGYGHDDLVVIMDGDCMPIRAFSLRELMRETPLIGIRKYWWVDRVEYLWVPLIAFDPGRLPDLGALRFHVAPINHKIFDTGAESYHYLKNHPDVRVGNYSASNHISFKHRSVEELCQMGYTKEEAELIKQVPWIELHIDNHFLHFGNSSAFNEDYYTKYQAVSEFLKKIL